MIFPSYLSLSLLLSLLLLLPIVAQSTYSRFLNITLTENSSNVAHLLRFDPAFQSLENIVTDACIDFSCHNLGNLIASLRGSLLYSVEQYYSKPVYSTVINSGSVGLGPLPALLIDFERNIDRLLLDWEAIVDSMIKKSQYTEHSREVTLELLAKSYFNDHNYDEAMSISYLYFKNYHHHWDKTSFDKTMCIIFAESARILGDIPAASWAYTMVVFR
jgi:hypothetical protein